uniref:Chitinase-3-like protein 1 n=1 Tax=Hirondellea gigas TaxID=1518452 RepID=A0A2P2I7W0_9CRUS
MKLFLILLGVVMPSLVASGHVMSCYWAATSMTSAPPYTFDVEQIDPFLCTHLMYSFAGIGDDYKIEVLNPELDLCDNGGRCGYERFTALKEVNKDLFTMLSVGGGGSGSATFSEMAGDPALRQGFVESVVALLSEFNFDGLDLDWESPTINGGKPEDKENYITLMMELRDALHGVDKIITTAVSAAKSIIDQAFDVPALSEAADYINIMGYDLHGSWNPFTHHHTILYPYYMDVGSMRYLNLDYAVQYWLSLGAPAEKLVLGLATYAHCWKLNNTDETGMYAPAHVPSGFPSTIAYNHMCDYYNVNKSATIVHEESMNEPYAYDLSHDNIWCGYDDAESLSIKAAYARDNGLAGAMVWTIQYDDFLGSCSPRPFHLIKSIVEALAAEP